MSLSKVFISSAFLRHCRDLLVTKSDLELVYRDSFAIATQEELVKEAKDCTAIICLYSDRFDAKTLDLLPELQIIANVAVGYDNIDLEYASKRNIAVLNTPDVLNNTTADMAFALMIALSRRVVEADRYVRAGLWQTQRFDHFLGSDLSGKRLGIVGLGRIGSVLVKRVSGFEMEVVYSNRKRLDSKLEKELNLCYLSLEELLSTSDYISLHCPLNEQTFHLIDEERLRLFKPTAYLINTARGGVVDSCALVDALKSGRLAGAGLDVFEDEPYLSAHFRDLENVVLTPHIGSGTKECRQAMMELSANSMYECLSGRKPNNLVNPQVFSKLKTVIRQ